MRNLLPILAAALAAAAPALHAAAPQAVWSRSVYASGGGALHPGSGSLARSPVGAAAATDRAGNLHVVASDGGTCMMTIKFAAPDGAELWRRSLCGAGATFGGAIALDASGSVFVTGTSGGEMVTAKYRANGVPAWEQRLRESGSDAGQAIVVDAAGDARVLAVARGATTDLRVIRHRGSDGAIAWQRTLDSRRDDAAAGLALDAGGNVAVLATTRNERADEDFWIVKLDAAGAIAWETRFDSGNVDVAGGIAFDPAGNVLATGMSDAGAAGNVMRTIKLAASSGAPVWERRLGGEVSGGTAVRAGPQGQVVVGGYLSRAGGQEIATVRYAADGALAWQALSAGPGALEFARAVAVDAAGHVLVTGASHGGDGAAEMRTVKYSGADGTELWSASHRGSAPGRDDAGHAVIALADGAYAVGLSTEAGRPPSLRVVRYRDAPAAQQTAFPPGANVQGLWWRPSEPGWGLNLTQQGDLLFATWFTYGLDGRPMWLVMSRGERVGREAWQGTVFEMRGPSFDSAPFEPSHVSSTPVGQASFVFSDADRGQFHFTVHGTSRSKEISRYVFAQPEPVCELGGAPGATPNFQDLWWAAPAGAESGWGLNVAHQGDRLFVTWFTYGTDGSGMWLVGSDFRRTGPSSYAGVLYRTAGAPFGAEPWDRAAFAAVPAGSASLAFEGADQGVFAYTVDGVSQSKRITRNVFAQPRTVCR